MRGLSAACLMLLALTTSSAQVSNTAMCDGIVAQVRSNASGGDPFAVLYKGDHPSIELANQEMKTDSLDRFLTRFNPSNALRQAWTDFMNSSNVEVLSLPDSDVHLATSTDGTALCQSFLFFQRVGLQSELLPELPRKGERDGDNLICNNYGSTGYLARIGGTEAFLETYSRDNAHRLRVVPLRNRRWGAACTVEAEFRTEYKVEKVFVPKDGRVTEAELRAVAAQLVERPGMGLGGLTEDDIREDYRVMRELSSKLDREPVPTFGEEGQLGPGEEFIRDAESYPVTLGSRGYLMRVGRGRAGCCVETDPALILYTLRDGKLEPVASAFVSRNRGALESLRAIPSR